MSRHIDQPLELLQEAVSMTRLASSLRAAGFTSFQISAHELTWLSGGRIQIANIVDVVFVLDDLTVHGPMRR